MFDLTPLTTTNVLTIVQILVVGVGFIFSWKGLKATTKNLKLAAQNAQAQLYNHMVVQGRDLQFKFVDLFHGGDESEKVEARQDHFVGTLVSYYSSCFELKKVLELPENVQRLLDSDLNELMREEQFRKKWDDIKHLHSKEFVSYVDGLRGVN